MNETLEQPILKVLHLDDDPFELDRVRQALEDHSTECHFQVESVATASDYLDRLRALKPQIAILDIHIDQEGLSGIDLVRRTRDLSPHTVILMCSGSDDVRTVAKSLNSGADDFISKQSDKGELSLRIFNAFRLGQLKAGTAAPSSLDSSRKKRRQKFVGQTMERVAKRAPLIIDSAISAIFIKGESGTGKEVVAEIFESQLGGSAPFIKVNCGAIAPTLLESELFGHVKGAFTGATNDKRGLLESASGGWVFLDEVATLSKSAQIALLRVLENQEIRRVGSPRATKINVRIISATNEDIPAKIAADEFRADLWQRLREAEIELPALHDRIDEIPALVEHFCKTMHGGPYRVSGPVMDVLKSASWREGNIRELRNCLRAMTEMHVDKLLTPLAIPERIWEELGETPGSEEETPGSGSAGGNAGHDGNLVIPWDDQDPASYDFMADALLLQMVRKLSESRGKMSLRSLAATIGMSRSTLSGRLKALVHRDVVPIEELVQLVGISEKST